VQRVFLHPADISAEERNYDQPEIGLLFREAVRKRRPDVVHVHNLAGLGIQAVEHCRELGIPVVMTLHDYWGVCFKNTMVKNDGSICRRNGPDCRGCVSHVGSDVRVPIEQRNDEIRHALDHVCRFIAPSDYLAGRYRDGRFDEQKIDVLSYGINLDRSRTFPRPRHRECVIGYTGYIGRHKGIHVLLEAIATVTGARLVLRGPCEDPDGYRERIRDLGLEDRVELRRPVPNHRVAKMLRKIDVAVLPSVWPDNHPVSILEAMAAGVPVVASRLGGIPELVRDGETGLLVEPGKPGELAQRIQQLVDDAPLRDTLGIAAREVAAAEYDIAYTIDALEGIYRKAMAFPLGKALETQTSE
jgi:glycosyltransferase involved in cell wall biosynthesis